MCDECKGKIKQASLVRILVSEGMGTDDTGQDCESSPQEYVLCSYKCFREWAAKW